MHFYRGDDRSPAEITAAGGFHSWHPTSPDAARNTLQAEIAQGRKPIDLMQAFQRMTSVYAVATARAQDGASEDKNFLYEIIIPDNRIGIREIKAGAVDQRPVSPSELDSAGIFQAFVVFDAPTLAEAQVIAFCHGRSTVNEATFLTSVPLDYVRGMKPKGSPGRMPFFPIRPKPAYVAA